VFLDHLRRPGSPRPSGGALAELLPVFDVRQRYETAIAAPPERVFAALRSVTLGDMPLVSLLFRARGLAAVRDRPLLEQLDVGMAKLAEDPGRELVYGAIGQPWKLRGGASRSVVDFASFDEPGFAKMAFDFRLEGGRLSTETRVKVTDAASRRHFRRYWLAIGPFSGLIRRRWLREITRRAEHPDG
jgi:hypothetical protein